MDTHYVNVDGTRIEVLSHGDVAAADRVLVFLHEGLGAAAQWRDLPRDLAEAKGCAAIAYSRAGYGASDPVALPRPLSYLHDEARVGLPRLLSILKIRRAILVGHSDGGSIALLRAGDDREGLLEALVLLAPHVFVEDVSVMSIALAKRTFEEGDLREKLKKWHGENVDVAFWGWNGAWLDPGFRAFNIESSLPKIHVPTLVLQGEEDPYGTIAQVEAIKAQCGGPVEVRLLPHCGHAPQRDAPELTREIISTFLRGLPLKPAA